MGDKHENEGITCIETVEHVGVDANGTENVNHSHSTSPKGKQSWRSFFWDSLDKPAEERRLVFKIDCALLGLGCLGNLS